MNKDAIVVIDGGINENATLTDVSAARVAKAVEAYKQGRAKKVVMSGGGRGPTGGSPAIKTEAQAMKEYAIQLGLPPESILLEEKSKDVIGNAFFSKISELEPSQWNNIIVVTSDYHIPRAEYVFDKILGPGYLMEFIQAENTLSPDKMGQLLADEKRKFDFAIEWLGPIKDGDSATIEEFIYHWHPAYVENEKISGTQIGERAKDF